MEQLTASEARKDFAEILNKVAYGGERIVLHRRGKRIAAIIPVAELELLERMIREEEDRIDRAVVRKAKREIAKEGTIPWEQVKQELDH